MEYNKKRSHAGAPSLKPEPKPKYRLAKRSNVLYDVDCLATLGRNHNKGDSMKKLVLALAAAAFVVCGGTAYANECNDKCTEKNEQCMSKCAFGDEKCTDTCVRRNVNCAHKCGS